MATHENLAQACLIDELGGRGTVDHSAAMIKTSSLPQATMLAAVGRLAGFFLLCVAALYVTHQSVDAGLRRIKTSHFGVFNKIVSGDINAEVLITGSSRALAHYDARIVQRSTGYTTFNIGVNGSQTDMQLAVLKT